MKRKLTQGFTLVELIVVIGIVVLLLGLLMPALGGIKAAGRSTQCVSNLRQMSLASQSYAAVYDVFPVALRFEQRDGLLVQVAWDWVTTMGGELIEPGPLWSFGNNPDSVQQCPEYHGSANYSGDPFTGYNYNTTYIGGEAPFPNVGFKPVRWGVKPHACQRSSQTAMFGDGGYSSGANKFMRAPLNSEDYDLTTIYAGTQAFRHTGSTNVVYIDGHVGSVQHARKGKFATAQLIEEIMDYPDNGFLSNDDSAYNPQHQ